MGQNYWKLGETVDGLASEAKRVDQGPISYFEFNRSNFGEFSTNLSTIVNFNPIQITTTAIKTTFKSVASLNLQSLRATADDSISPTKTTNDFRQEAQRRTGAISARTIVMVVPIS